MKFLSQKGQIRSWIIALLLILIALGGFLLVNQNKKGSTPQTQTTEQQVKTVKADLVIKYGGTRSGDSFTGVEVNEGKTALDLTKKVAEVKTSGEGTMAFATTINGRTAETAKKEFWELLVNGKSADVGAGTYKVKNNDKIEWRISTY